jgi:hypothetical protein
LYKLLGNKKLVTALLYRGSFTGWKKDDFHKACDYKGPTVTLFKVKDGDCIGGFTMTHWKSPDSMDYIDDRDAMLFNLSCFRHFPSTLKGKEIYCNRSYGPVFGGFEGCELFAYLPSNTDHRCGSGAN